VESEESEGAKRTASVRGIVRLKHAKSVDEYIECVRGGIMTQLSCSELKPGDECGCVEIQEDS